MRLERVKLQLEVPQVPQGDGFVGRTRGQDEFGIRVEGEAVDFGRVGVDDVRGFVRVVGSRVPNHQLLVIGHGTEQRFVQQMPGNIFNNGRVTVIDG